MAQTPTLEFSWLGSKASKESMFTLDKTILYAQLLIYIIPFSIQTRIVQHMSYNNNSLSLLVSFLDGPKKNTQHLLVQN